MNEKEWFKAVSDLTEQMFDGKPKPAKRIAELYREAARLGIPTEALAIVDANWL